LLAGLPEKEILRLVRMKGLPRVAAQTLTSKSALLAELAKVRQQGYAIDNRENEIEGRCIGAPIYGPDGDGIEYFKSGFSRYLAQVRGLAPSLKETCKAISEALGK
jgi:DNA-binding IclR family transcriptional regulator